MPGAAARGSREADHRRGDRLSIFLRPPVIVGWFAELPSLGSGESARKRRARRLGYWAPDSDRRSPRAEVFGHLMGLIFWMFATFVVVLPATGWLVRSGVPVPLRLFAFLMCFPLAMLVYVGLLSLSAPVKSQSQGWMLALSWPAEAAVGVVVGAVVLLV